jgi:hypothetical protein
MSAFQIIPFVAYIAVAHPATYKATRGVLGNWVASADGLATLKGVALHAVVFVLLATLLMRLLVPIASGYAPSRSQHGVRTPKRSPPPSGQMSEYKSAMYSIAGR